MLNIFCFSKSFAQQNIERGDYYGEKEISATSSVVLKPGFWAGKGSDLRIFIQPNSSSTCTPLSINTTNSYNNLIVYSALIPGIKNIEDFANKTICEATAEINYIDGFNRQLQTILTYSSVNQRDVVIANEYNWLGKQNKDFLPFENNASGGSFVANALTPGYGVYSFYSQGISGVEANSLPFSENRTDGSPLGSIIEQSHPGVTWQLDSEHTIRKNFASNNANIFNPYNLEGCKRVALYTAFSSNESCTLVRTNGNKIYADNELLIKISKDENWKSSDGCVGTVEEYFDKIGRIILKRSYNKKVSNEVEMLSTYYVYDQFGSLCFVLPPNFEADIDNAITADKLNNLTYLYVFDNRGRVIEKKIPSKGKEFFVYNALNQVVLSQDANQRDHTPQQWSFLKYDEHGRVIIAGEFEDQASLADQNIIPDNSRRKYLQLLANNQTLLNEKRDHTQFNGYSNVSFPTVSVKSLLKVNYFDDYNIPGLPQNYNLSSSYSNKITGYPTASKTAILNNPDDALWTVSFYDNRGRNVKTINQHYKGGIINYGNYNDYESTINYQGQLVSSIQKHFLNGVQQVKIANNYIYNTSGLLEQTNQGINDNTPIILTKNNYNSLGQLIIKKLHSENGGASYLQEINYSYNERGWLKKAISGLFKFELAYQSPSLNAIPQFNGNISSQNWGATSINSAEVLYRYDNLNRLTSAVGGGMSENNVQYDKVGNIINLNRDETSISYTYDSINKNKLLSVLGASLYSGLYQYDLNGNATHDGSKNNIDIKYNLLNQPWQVSGSTNITYKYDATGKMLSKSSNATGLKEYVDFVQYGTVNNIYAIEALKIEGGRVLRNSDGSYHYQYDLSDHLGNTRVTFDRDPATGLARRVQSDDYYGFGKRKSVGPVSLDNKYLYNGKELQEEIGEYDYGARFYNPEIARWSGIDALAEDYGNTSPYAYVVNNPVNFTDPDGMQVNPYITPINGSWEDRRWIPEGSQIPIGWEIPKSIASGSVFGTSPGWTKGKVLNPELHQLVVNATHGEESIRPAKFNFWDNWGMNENFFAKMGYDLIDAPYVWSTRNFTTLGARHLDQRPATPKEVVDAGMAMTNTAFISLVGPEIAVMKTVGELKPLGLGSTGRVTAKNLVEEMTMEAVKKQPHLGTRIMEGLSDSRWNGWTKMEFKSKTNEGINAVVHYVGKWENGILKAVDDFKFK